MIRRSLGFTVLSALAFLMASPAEADTIYDWTVSIPLTTGGTLAGSGQLVASDTLSTGYDGKYTGFLVSSITGTYDGSTITGLAAVDTNTNDNLVNTSQALVDLDGISFYISPTIPWDTTPINLFYKPGSGYTDGGSRTQVTGVFTLVADSGSVTGTPTLPGLPESGPWPFFALALLAIVLLRRNGWDLGLGGRTADPQTPHPSLPAPRVFPRQT